MIQTRKKYKFVFNNERELIAIVEKVKGDLLKVITSKPSASGVKVKRYILNLSNIDYLKEVDD